MCRWQLSEDREKKAKHQEQEQIAAMRAEMQALNPGKQQQPATSTDNTNNDTRTDSISNNSTSVGNSNINSTVNSNSNSSSNVNRTAATSAAAAAATPETIAAAAPGSSIQQDLAEKVSNPLALSRIHEGEEGGGQEDYDIITQ